MPAFETQLDLLYFSLTIFVGCMTILGSLILIKVVRILGDIQKITGFIKETSQLINEYAWKPIEIFLHLKDFIFKNLK